MALLFLDGFDAGDYTTKWSSYTGGTASATVTRFNIGRSMTISNYFWGLKRQFSTPISTIYVGWAMQTATGGLAGTDTYVSLWGDDGATLHLRLALNTSSTLKLVRGDGTTLATSGAGTFITGQWNYIEVMATIADSGGRCIVRVNGANIIDFTGDTKNGGTNTTFDTVVLGDTGSNNGPRSATYYDDLYVCDATGSAPHNTFLGEIRIQTVVPNGAGSSTQFTPSTGANYTTVDELPFNTADYVYGDTTGLRDLYTLSDISTGTIFYGVQNNFIAHKTDVNSLQLKSAIKTGGTIYYGSNAAITPTDKTQLALHAINPNTSLAWTMTDINGLEAGFEVV